MSGEALEWAVNTFPYLKEATHKVVLVKLAHRVRKGDATGFVWVGVDCTAADTGTSRRSVLRAQKHFEALGLIRVERRANKSSHIFLQLNFLLEVGDTVAPQAVLKTQPVVPKSHPVGANLAPLEVPNWHPNKTMNQTMNQKQQQPVVVFQNLVWEKPLTEGEKEACIGIFASSKLPINVCQKFADEMAGSGRQAPIRSPAGWLSNMIVRFNKPGFAFGYSDQVAAQRAGRAEQERRESLSVPPKPTIPAPPKKLSDVGRKALAAMGKHPQLVPACHQTVPL